MQYLQEQYSICNRFEYWDVWYFIVYMPILSLYLILLLSALQYHYCCNTVDFLRSVHVLYFCLFNPIKPQEHSNRLTISLCNATHTVLLWTPCKNMCHQTGWSLPCADTAVTETAGIIMTFFLDILHQQCLQGTWLSSEHCITCWCHCLVSAEVTKVEKHP